MNTKGRLHPAAVEFKEMECCALKWAIDSGYHDGFIKTSIVEAKKIAPEYQCSMLVEVFALSQSISFIPYPVRRDFYLNLSINEKSRLEKMPGDCFFPCGHHKAQHIKALDHISFMMIYPQGNN